MFTRSLPVHQYWPEVVERVNTPGAIVIRPAGVDSDKHISVSMAIARPNSSPSPDGAPLYLNCSQRPNGTLLRGGVMAFAPSVPQVEMDPSDPSTWQREYRFT